STAVISYAVPKAELLSHFPESPSSLCVGNFRNKQALREGAEFPHHACSTRPPAKHGQLDGLHSRSGCGRHVKNRSVYRPPKRQKHLQPLLNATRTTKATNAVRAVRIQHGAEDRAPEQFSESDVSFRIVPPRNGILYRSPGAFELRSSPQRAALRKKNLLIYRPNVPCRTSP